jgi:hypothetical protein
MRFERPRSGNEPLRGSVRSALDSGVRDTLLTRVYFAYEVPWEQKGQSKAIFDQRDNAFKELFRTANAKYKDYVVFGGETLPWTGQETKKAGGGSSL